MGVRVFEYTWEDVTRRAPYVTESMRDRLALADRTRPVPWSPSTLL
jgi:hypothetical protein